MLLLPSSTRKVGSLPVLDPGQERRHVQAAPFQDRQRIFQFVQDVAADRLSRSPSKVDAGFACCLPGVR